MKGKTVYEHPLNENIRNWLRLEHLFSYTEQHIKGLSVWDSREAVQGILGILEYLARMDCKPDLIKDLERQLRVLKQWQAAPDVDTVRLEELLAKLQALIEALSIMEGQPGQTLVRHHLLSTIKQRVHIAGGGCGFDVPAYHHWLNQSHKQRQQDLQEWVSAFYPLKEAITLNLYLIRQQAVVEAVIAKAGFYQARFDDTADVQMLQVFLPGELQLYPEISGGRHRFTLRFFEQAQLHKSSVQTTEDIEFELACCKLK